MESSPSIRIVVADDHLLFREAVRRFLATEPDFLVVGEAADGEEAVAQCGRLKPDVLLLDVSMPRLSGIDALARLRKEPLTTAVVLLTAGIDRGDLLEALILGVRGVVLKTAETDTLVKCIRTVASGGFWIEHGAIGDLVEKLRSPGQPPRPSAAVPKPPSLTPRELQIVSAVINGASNADIGESFGLRGQTVKNHLTKIFDKVGVSTRVELALYALNHGLGGLLTGGAIVVAPPAEAVLPRA
jgi:two-component system, NarL family, nitrate/nitrite response regulator NarL